MPLSERTNLDMAMTPAPTLEVPDAPAVPAPQPQAQRAPTAAPPQSLEEVQTLGGGATRESASLIRDVQILDGLQIDRGNWQGGMAALASGDPIGLESWDFGALADGSPAASMKDANGEDIVVKLPASVWMSVIQNRSASRIAMKEKHEHDLRVEGVQQKLSELLVASPDADPTFMQGLSQLALIDPEAATKYLTMYAVEAQRDRNKKSTEEVLYLNKAHGADVLGKSLGERGTQRLLALDVARRGMTVRGEDTTKVDQEALDLNNIGLWISPPKATWGMLDAMAVRPEQGQMYGRVAHSGFLGLTVSPPLPSGNRISLSQVISYGDGLDSLATHALNGWQPSTPQAKIAVAMNILESQYAAKGEHLEMDPHGNLTVRSNNAAPPLVAPQPPLGEPVGAAPTLGAPLSHQVEQPAQRTFRGNPVSSGRMNLNVYSDQQ